MADSLGDRVHRARPKHTYRYLYTFKSQKTRLAFAKLIKGVDKIRTWRGGSAG